MIKTRTFHGIGQGAFYSEKHEGFHIVYDCGTSNSPKYISQEIQQTFNQNDKVILFISHFDKDHISGINELRNRTNITHVIMPLLYDEDIVLRIAYLRANRLNEKILANPKEYYGEKTKIIYVSPPDSNGKPNESLNLNDSLKEFDSKEPADINIIPSGTMITNGKSDWVFVPYNYDNQNRHQKVIDLLEKNNINPQKLIENPSCAVEYLTNNPKKLRDIFNHIGQYNSKRYGSFINENSMFLYSGPIIEPYKVFCKIHDEKANVFIYGLHTGCIYTGDGNLNLVELNSIYSRFIQNAGTVQIPHHGSKHNFKEDCFIRKNYICPISTGFRNLKSAENISDYLTIIGCFPYIITTETKSLQEFFSRCLDIDLEKPIYVWPEKNN